MIKSTEKANGLNIRDEGNPPLRITNGKLKKMKKMKWVGNVANSHWDGGCHHFTECASSVILIFGALAESRHWYLTIFIESYCIFP